MLRAAKERIAGLRAIPLPSYLQALFAPPTDRGCLHCLNRERSTVFESFFLLKAQQALVLVVILIECAGS